MAALQSEQDAEHDIILQHEEEDTHATLAGFLRGLARSLGRGGVRTIRSVSKGRLPVKGVAKVRSDDARQPQ